MGYHAGIYPLFSGFPSFSASILADACLFRCLMPQAHFHVIASIQAEKSPAISGRAERHPTD